MRNNSNGRRQIVVVEAPAHPVAQLQGPFEESMFESQSVASEENDVPLDASTRRNMLLEAPTYQRVIAGRWKQKPGEKFHPLWKLVAQMSFGIHLLSEGMAKSEEDVFQILQNHVDDIDVFLERTTEDFTLAQDDIQERLKWLKLPLQHPKEFERMLEDRNFRSSIVEGNEKIEHIVNRTANAMKDALKDVQKGFDSTNALEKYLTELAITWVRKTQEHEAVFVAMMGNVEGWKKAFLDLHMQGNKLAGSLAKLTEVVNQMQQKAGEVSRRLVRQQNRSGGSAINSNSFTYHSRQQSPVRSASRQQQALPNTRKAMPGDSRTPSRQHTRTASRETPRADSGQAQRSGTGLSMRSGNGRSETPASRSASRTDTPSGSQDPTRLNLGSPRLVQVTNNPGHHRANSISASVRVAQVNGADSRNGMRNDSALSNRSATPQHQLKTKESTISVLDQPTPRIIQPKQFAPVELPAEIPPEAFLQAPLSNRNNRLSGLGFLPSERRAQAATTSSAFNPATALVELLRDPSRYSKLPLTPSSPTSQNVPKEALLALEGNKHLAVDAQAVRREPTPEQSPPTGEENTSDDTPITPAWAAQVVNDEERKKVLAEKIPFSSQTPKIDSEGDAAATPKAGPSKPVQPKLDTAVESSTGGPSNASANGPSELSAGYDENIPRLTRQQAEAAMMIDTPEISTKQRKKLSFIAELEGCEPVYLPSTVYTPISAVTKASEAHELQGSDSYFSLPIQVNGNDPISAAISELSSDRSSRLVTLDETTLNAATSDQIQIVLEEAIRKSTSDAEAPVSEPPPIPETTTTSIISELPTQMTPRPPHTHQAPPPVVQHTSEVDDAAPLSNPKTVAVQVKPLEQQSALTDTMASEKIVSTTPAAELTPTPATENSIDVETAKARPITTIHAPNGGKQSTLQLPSSPGSPSAKSSPNVDTLAVITKSGAQLRPKSLLRSVSETKVPKRLSIFPPLKPLPNAKPIDVTGPASPASAPDTTLRTSPKSSMSDKSPASLMSVHSAPATDLARSTTKESRKQWKAFFSGQLKSPKSPSTSVKSLKSPSASIGSSHKHTNSQTSQTNSSVKTMYLNSPGLPQSPTKEDTPLAEGEKTSATVQSPNQSEVTRPSVADIRQASSPTLGLAQAIVGLGLTTSDSVQSPVSAAETPVIATAITSTAYTRQAPRSVSAGSSPASGTTAKPTMISIPKPRMIEVRRKAVGSGVSSGQGSRPSSAAEKDRKDDMQSDETKLSVKPGSRSTTPVRSPTPQTDDDKTPRIGPADVKPKLVVETAKPQQIQIVRIGKAPSAVHIAGHTPDISPKTKPEDIKQSSDVQTPTQLQNSMFSNSNTRHQSAGEITTIQEEDSGDDHSDILDAYT